MHLNGIAKRITALALGAALLTATALPAFAEGTQKITYNAGNYTFEKISHPTKGTMSADGIVDYIGDGAVNVITDPATRTTTRATAARTTAGPLLLTVTGCMWVPATRLWATR